MPLDSIRCFSLSAAPWAPRRPRRRARRWRQRRTRCQEWRTVSLSQLRIFKSTQVKGTPRNPPRMQGWFWKLLWNGRKVIINKLWSDWEGRLGTVGSFKTLQTVINIPVKLPKMDVYTHSWLLRGSYQEAIFETRWKTLRGLMASLVNFHGVKWHAVWVIRAPIDGLFGRPTVIWSNSDGRLPLNTMQVD